MDQRSSQKHIDIKRHVCQLCGADADAGAELRPGVLVRPAIGELILKEFGHWDETGWICASDLQRFRHKYVQSLIETEKGALTDLERQVIESIKEQEILAKDPIQDADDGRTAAQRLADQIADFGGSWKFISIFGLVLVLWMAVNSYLLVHHAFDPYPYILLNLVLSCLAAIQAPIIMMSQNRQEDRDRLRAMHDYQVNLKAELEIRYLHQKLDHLMSHQWEMLLEIQNVQMELIDELRASKKEQEHR